MARLILASGSEIRQTLLRNAAVPFDAVPARVDEDAIRKGLAAEGAAPRDIADALADAKARRGAQKYPDRMVLGCDQILAQEQRIFTKPADKAEAHAHLMALSGGRHTLYSAAVIYDQARPVWRHVGTVRLQMRVLGDTYLTDYLDRNWDSVRHSVGAYKLEEEGIRLFQKIEGDYFTVLGLPLIEVLNYLTARGTLPG